MKTTYLQSMIRINAARITELGFYIADLRSDAIMYKAIGEKSFAASCYSIISSVERKIVKAVTLQQGMKAELSSIYRAVRIANKQAKIVATTGIITPSGENLLAVQREKLLDSVLARVVPIKADTRTADHPSFSKKQAEIA